MFDLINGLPVHALVVHVVVVLVPLMSVVTVVFVVRPKWRPELPWAILGSAGAFLASFVAKESGEKLQARLSNLQGSEVAAHHAALGRDLQYFAFAQLVADRHLSLSVNASVTSLHDPDWQDHFRAVCRRHPGAASRLTVEITETCAVADLEATRAVLLALKALDIKIAIDDFGSGHSSFRNLRDLPIDYLKIDGAFARNLAQSPDDRFFIRTLIDLAKNLRIPTVAEWVEDEATAQILTDWGIDLLQGHLFGRAEVTVITQGPVLAFG